MATYIYLAHPFAYNNISQHTQTDISVCIKSILSTEWSDISHLKLSTKSKERITYTRRPHENLSTKHKLFSFCWLFRKIDTLMDTMYMYTKSIVCVEGSTRINKCQLKFFLSVA